MKKTMVMKMAEDNKNTTLDKMTAYLFDQYNFPTTFQENDFFDMRYSHHPSGEKFHDLFEDYFKEEDFSEAAVRKNLLYIGKDLFGVDLTGYRLLYFQNGKKEFFRMDGYRKSPYTAPLNMVTVPFNLDSRSPIDMSVPMGECNYTIPKDN